MARTQAGYGRARQSQSLPEHACLVLFVGPRGNKPDISILESLQLQDSTLLRSYRNSYRPGLDVHASQEGRENVLMLDRRAAHPAGKSTTT